MQTIKVTVKTDNRDNVTGFYNGGTCIAHISPDFYHRGRYAGYFGIWAACDNSDFPGAVEFISDAICDQFKAVGLNVEFN